MISVFQDYHDNTQRKIKMETNMLLSDKLFHLSPLVLCRMTTFWLNGEETSSETESAVGQGLIIHSL